MPFLRLIVQIASRFAQRGGRRLQWRQRGLELLIQLATRVAGERGGRRLPWRQEGLQAMQDLEGLEAEGLEGMESAGGAMPTRSRILAPATASQT